MEKIDKLLELAKSNPKKLIIICVIIVLSLILSNCALKFDELHIKGYDTEVGR